MDRPLDGARGDRRLRATRRVHPGPAGLAGLTSGAAAGLAACGVGSGAATDSGGQGQAPAGTWGIHAPTLHPFPQDAAGSSPTGRPPNALEEHGA
jgi:hypothetical protein